MNKATRVNEFTPDSLVDGWLTVALEQADCFKQYKSLPEIVEYEGERFYKMSYNSDSLRAIYRVASNRAYHERYSA